MYDPVSVVILRHVLKLYTRKFSLHKPDFNMYTIWDLFHSAEDATKETLNFLF